jgi:hypothetical protein
MMDFQFIFLKNKKIDKEDSYLNNYKNIYFI